MDPMQGTTSGTTVEHIPNFLLSAPPTPSASNTPSAPPQGSQPFAASNSLFRSAASPPTTVTFNERLRAGGGSATPARTPATPTPATPARMPPARSLLDDVGSGNGVALPARNSITPRASATATPSTIHRDSLERWVTVFGFSPPQEAAVLAEMRRHGDVVRTVAGRGNWTHVMYAEKVGAQVALYRRWRLLPGATVMIGTVPCTEPDVALDAERRVENAIVAASPAAARRSLTPSSPASSRRASLRTPSLRTPVSLMARDVSSTATPVQAVRTPQPQKGFFAYISDYL